MALCAKFKLTSVSPKMSNKIMVVIVHNAMIIFMQRMCIFAKLASVKAFSTTCTMGIVAKPNRRSMRQIPYKLSLAV